jgi:uncharacterized protein YyaL (SSP411 family)
MTVRPLARTACLGLLAFALVASGGDPTPAADPKGKEKGMPNRLAKESSPYLLQHAHNPVDWFPWGPEAFEKAKREKKLIFLSIGYSSCHWCHVMERESFSDPAVAKVLNEHFVCIKVDREERPDVDDIYMTALSVYGEGGGWPLSMFLTPEGKPIFGGTYFPPEDKMVGEGTVYGFRTVLKKVTDFDKADRDGLLKQADRVAEATVEALERNTRFLAIVDLNRELIAGAAGAFSIDPQYGGTGSKARDFAGTKFPRAAVWGFLLGQGRKPKNEPLAAAVKLTLRQMAEGGIYDQLGGGFHRYSTERTWTVPHFEKMLYDNAQLVELYAEAYRLGPDPLYKRVIAETLGFVKREMTSQEGAFYSALDADSNGHEGEFYVWTADELKQVLGNDSDLTFIRAIYGVATPNFEGKYHILRLPKPTAELAKELKVTEGELLSRLEPLKLKLLAHRAKRERPFLDTKVIAGWNGQMIAGYARAGQVLKEPAYTAVAAKAADFVLSKMRDKDGRLLRTYAAAPGQPPTAKGNAFLDDYAYVIHGLLTLHDATGEKRWLDEAKALAATLDKWYGDAVKGGYFYTAHDHEKLFARAKDGYDGAQPSGNGTQVRNLLRLWQKTKDAAYRERAEKSIKLFAAVLKSNPTSVPVLARAVDELLDATGDATAAKPPVGPTDSPKNPRASSDVVTATLKANPPGEDGARSWTVSVTIAPGWHIYANPVGSDTLRESETTAELIANGKPVKDATITYPRGKPYKDSTGAEYPVYEGTVTITASVPPRKDLPPVEVHVRVTACKEGKCLLPSVIKLK